jgi:hypothetical protein
VTPHEVLHHKYRATRRHRPQVRHNRDRRPAAIPAALAHHVRKDHHRWWHRAQEALLPGKAFVMAFVWSGWLIASVIAFMIVAYASFFGIGVIGLMIWFVTARVDMEQDGVVGAGVSPGFLAQQVKVRTEMSRAERAALHGRQLLEKQSTRFFRYLGIALTLAGFGGFVLFQI